jgi:hypothetical protein
MHHDINIVSGTFCSGFVLCINGLGTWSSEAARAVEIAEIYKALCLKPVRSTADLQTKNYTCVAGLVDADAMICRDYLVLITRCQLTVLWRSMHKQQNFLCGTSMDNICRITL